MRRRPFIYAGAILAVLLAAVGVVMRHRTPGPTDYPEPRPGDQQPMVLELLSRDLGLAPGWIDLGYAPHVLRKGAAVEVDFSAYGGLLLARPKLVGYFGGVALTYLAPESYGDFLEVQLQDAAGKPFARVPVLAKHARVRPDGAREVWLPMSALNPRGEPIERVLFFAWKKVAAERVVLERAGFTGLRPADAEPPRAGEFTVDCAGGRPISPLVYGMGGADGAPWTAGATARRWGGNPASRYNWELNAWNTGSDWFFQNEGDLTRTYRSFLEENAAHGLKTALTVPMLGWVAKDVTSHAFSVAVYGDQRAAAPEQSDAGNGVTPDGKLLEPRMPSVTSVPSTPESIGRWVRTIRDQDGAGRSVHAYILDNEPMLWSVTHRDVHPEPTTYDELMDRTLAYAAAVRRADPDAVIAGPAEWGWPAYFDSARDREAALRTSPDRAAHGGVPLVPWYLRTLRQREERSGARFVDVLDLHYYPMAAGLGVGTGGATDPATAALRIRATRSLWDPSYVDESWIKQPIRLLPRMREWVKENHPRLSTSVGEWNFGAEGHMSGGLAVAEALGHFGVEGLDSAYYWTSPGEGTPAFWAFRAFRNFDGAGGRFLDHSAPVRGQAPLAALFASRDADAGHLVLVLLNEAPAAPLEARIRLAGCPAMTTGRAFTYQGGADGFRSAPVTVRPGEVRATAAGYSITVVELTAAPGR